MGIAAYLTYVHYDQGALVCGGGGCHTVQASRYAEVGMVPVALLGLGLYLAVMLLGLVRWFRPGLLFYATVAAFALTLGGAVYTAYLTYLEIAVIHAICQWCVASGIVMIGLLVCEGIGASRAVFSGDPNGDRREGHQPRPPLARTLRAQRGR